MFGMEMHLAPRFLGILVLLVAILAVLHWARRFFWLFSLLVLPGTICHELCHLGVGVLLRGQPRRFSVAPRRENGSYVLGSVSFARIRWYNAFFIGLAPLLLLPLAYGGFSLLEHASGFGWKEGLGLFVVANLLYASWPSWQDVRVAARSPIGWLLLAAGVVWLGFRGWPRALVPGPIRIAAWEF